MGSSNCAESCRTITRKQILKTSNEKQKNCKPEFKTCVQFDRAFEVGQQTEQVFDLS